MSNALTNRLGKELAQLATSPPEGVSVDPSCSADLRQWSVSVAGAPGTLYEGESFTLQFTFPDQYPFSSPEVVFVGDNIPVHPHVYSNGHICLSILTEDWTPALSVQSVCLSILSMLSSSKGSLSSPEVVFVGDNIPVHPHVYSNGHICLSILTEDWTPALSVQSVCLSILSMLSSSKGSLSSPEVVFVGDNIPVHPHVYSNGHICLSILTEDWTPALSVQSVCLSILSMLSSSKGSLSSPEVVFVGDNIPVHPHVYSNGHICLSILTEDWTPALSVQSVCLSILSMLSSSKGSLSSPEVVFVGDNIPVHPHVYSNGHICLSILTEDWTPALSVQSVCLSILSMLSSSKGSLSSPEVVFVGDNIPVHPHVYSNGHICLSILTEDWTPALSVQSVCLSILSMLSSSKGSLSSPEVVFVGDNIPVHPHVYSNGHICLSILTEDWTPALSVQSVCLSILSMLSSSKGSLSSPEVVFVGDNIPVHPHVYSNGHICLSILTEDWTPALSVQSVCLSILSMLSSSKGSLSSPEVVFVGDNIPVHPHVYSNGHICLSILTEDWTPALSVQSVCLSILSMLSSSKDIRAEDETCKWRLVEEKKRPPDNALYVRTCSKNPKKTRWWFHDENV